MEFYFRLTHYRYWLDKHKKTVQCLRVSFPSKHASLKQYLKQLGMRWDVEKQHFYFVVPDGRKVEEWNEHLEKLVNKFYQSNPDGGDSTPQRNLKVDPIMLEQFDRKSAAIMDRLPESHHEILTRYQQMLYIKRYSSNTVRSYRPAFISFLGWCGSRLPLDLSLQDVIDYMTLRIAHGNISETYQNLIINSIKFYYEKVENKPRTIYMIPRPKQHLVLPKLLDKEEVSLMIEKTENVKHKAMLMLMYGCGLRLNEVTHLIPFDIDSKRMVVHLRRAKGKKDRDVHLPIRLLNCLREYFKVARPMTWLFEGQNIGEPYSDRSVQMVVKNAAKRAGIQRPVTAHMLRHSFATHLLESGMDFRRLQEALGHASIKTTEIYTHVTAEKIAFSPLDDL